MLKRIGDIIAVKVPEKSFGFDINNFPNRSDFMFMLDIEDIDETIKNDETLIVKELPIGPWQLIGLSHLLTSEQKEMVLHILGEIYLEKDPDSKYNSYNVKNIDDSYQSWLEANGILHENPFGKEKPQHYDYEEMQQSGHYSTQIEKDQERKITEWEEAQLKVGNWVLFKLKYT